MVEERNCVVRDKGIDGTTIRFGSLSKRSNESWIPMHADDEPRIPHRIDERWDLALLHDKRQNQDER